MLSSEEIKDAQALKRLLADKDMHGAVERLIHRLNNDIIRRWSEDETIKRQYVRGAREMLVLVLDNIRESVERLAEHEESEQDLLMARRVSEDGFGSGDLAS